MESSIAFLPSWPLAAPELLWFALTLVAAAVMGEFFFDRLRLPRITGYSLAGLIAGALGAGEAVRAGLISGAGWSSIVVELALGLLLFELGNRVNLRWLRDNPWLLATSALEAALTFLIAFVLLRAVGFDVSDALLAAIISMATAPAIVLRVVAETRAQGQVSDRLMVLSALNSIYTVLAVQLAIGALHQTYRNDPIAAVSHPLYLICGALLGGLALAYAMRALRRRLLLEDEHSGAVLIGLILAAVLVLKMLKLPVLLSLLVGGLLVRQLGGRAFVLPRGLNAVSGLLVLSLFVLTGLSVQLSSVLAGGLIAVLLIGARLVAKTTAVLLLARPSGVSWRQGLALGVALTPLSGVTLVLTYDLLGVFPELAPRLATTVLAVIALLELLGPVLVRWMLDWAGETTDHLRSTPTRPPTVPAAARRRDVAPATVGSPPPVEPSDARAKVEQTP